MVATYVSRPTTVHITALHKKLMVIRFLQPLWTVFHFKTALDCNNCMPLFHNRHTQTSGPPSSTMCLGYAIQESPLHTGPRSVQLFLHRLTDIPCYGIIGRNRLHFIYSMWRINTNKYRVCTKQHCGSQCNFLLIYCFARFNGS